MFGETNPPIQKKGWAYRCKTRIIGYHTFDEETLPDAELPWCHVLVDASKGAGQGSCIK